MDEAPKFFTALILIILCVLVLPVIKFIKRRRKRTLNDRLFHHVLNDVSGTRYILDNKEKFCRHLND